VSASRGEIQILADQMLEALGSRIVAGQMVIHFSEGVVQRVEINTIHKPQPHPKRYAIVS